ncbi:hypothetical protein OG900_29160 [Streptomyces sp. NBC_00433]
MTRPRISAANGPHHPTSGSTAVHGRGGKGADAAGAADQAWTLS